MNDPGTLASLKFLTFGDTGRPRSRTQSTPPPSGSPQAFNDFPDFSKRNAKRHNASRTDTFKTAGKSGSSLRKRSIVPATDYGDQLKTLKDTHVESCMRHDMREIGNELVAGVEEGVQQAMDGIRTHVQETLSVLTDTRESTAGIIMNKIGDHVTTTLEASGWPLRVDFTPIQEEIRVGEQARVEAYRESMRLMQGSVMGQLQSSLKEIESLRDEQRLLREEGHATQTRVIEELRENRHGFAEGMSALLKKVVELEVENNARRESAHEHHHDLPNLLAMRGTSMNVDFAPVLAHVESGRKAAQEDVEKLRGDVQSVQKTLKDEFVEMRSLFDDAVISGGGSRRSDRVCEANEIWTQTETRQYHTDGTQTDEHSWESSPRFNKANTSRNTVRKSKSAPKKPPLSPIIRKKQEQGVFADAETLRSKARLALIKPQYNVFDHYHESGCMQRIARSPKFENLTFFVVLINSIWIAVDADLNDEAVLINAHPVFQVAENLFCSYFTGELIIRFLAFKVKRRCLRDAWFVFDLFLVTMMILDTWLMYVIFAMLDTDTAANHPVDSSVLRMIRIAKLLRLSRMAKLMRSVPELIVLIKGIGAAARSVAVVLLLWGIIIYIFAVVFVQLAEGDMKEQFANVPQSMRTLLLDGVLPDNATIVRLVVNSNALLWPFIMAFVLLASLTLSYMLIGVLVETVHNIAATEKESMTVGAVAQHMRKEWTEVLGNEMDTTLSKKDFQHLLTQPTIARFLSDMGVDMVVLVDMSEMIYDDIVTQHQSMGFEHLVDAVLNMRGTNTVTVKDIKSQLRIIKAMVKEAVSDLDVKMEAEFFRARNEARKLKKLVIAGDGESVWSDSDESDMPCPSVSMHSQGTRRGSLGTSFGEPETRGFPNAVYSSGGSSPQSSIASTKNKQKRPQRIGAL